MRGPSAFFFEVLLPGLVVSLFAFYIFKGIRKGWRGSRDSAEPQPAGTRRDLGKIISLSAFVMSIVLATAATSLRAQFWRLQSQDVLQIEIGTRSFTDASSIKMIVQDLNTSEWYTVNHGGWGDESSMVLTMKSGDRWYMQVGYHFTEHGAVIRRSSAQQGRGWNYGQVFSVTLPGTLEKLGVPLSHCDIAHGNPCVVSSAPSKY